MYEDFRGVSRGTPGASNWDSSYDRPAVSNQNFDYAGFPRRAAGAVIDYAIPFFLFAWLPGHYGFKIGFIGFWIWVVINSVVIQSQSGGHSLGKIVFGTQVVHITEVGEYRQEYAQRPTWGTLLLRQFAHIVDMATLWGWLRPLKHDQYRTYADSLAATIVIRSGTAELRGERYLQTDPPRPNRWTYP